MKIQLNSNHGNTEHIIRVMQGDSGRTLEIDFTDIDISKVSKVQIFVQKPSGKVVYANGKISGERAEIQLDSQMISEVGEALSVVMTEDSQGKTISTYPLIIKVLDSPVVDNAESSENKLLSEAFQTMVSDEISKKLAEFQTAIDELRTAKQNLETQVSFTEEELTILRNAGIEV